MACLSAYGRMKHGLFPEVSPYQLPLASAASYTNVSQPILGGPQNR